MTDLRRRRNIVADLRSAWLRQRLGVTWAEMRERAYRGRERRHVEPEPCPCCEDPDWFREGERETG